MGRSATVDFVLPFFGMYDQACRGILRLCRGLMSEEVCVVDIFVVSFYVVDLLVKFVCFLS